MSKGIRGVTKAGILFLVAGVVQALAEPRAGVELAKEHYNRTDYEAALKVLAPIPEKTGVIYSLVGRSHYMLADYKKASEAFEKAVGLEPQKADYWHWLGRAYGRRAEMSSPFTAIRWAGKTKQAFEKAVELDPKGLEAMNDLFEYYLQAPGFLGGGLEKASNLAGRIAQSDPVEGHYAVARLAEQQKEFHTAESQLRRAVDLAPQQVGRAIDLAKFLAKQGRYRESDQIFAHADKVAPNSPKVMFGRAQTYVETKRNLDLARRLLESYLNASLTPEDPPRWEAEKLLKQVSGG
jgi:tetratricopeptide (TPR) repeat protein